MEVSLAIGVNLREFQQHVFTPQRRHDVIVIDARFEPADAAKFTEQVRSLLKTSESGSGFEKQYFDALQRDPDVVLAHADVARLLKAKK